jgi:ABC-2 type transport system ATP-binding protein
MITTSGLTMSFGKLKVLDVDRLTIPSATTAVLTGPNGAGKSTLLMILSGLLRPTTGSITIDRNEPGSLGARSVVSFVPDQPALFDDLTLNDQLHYVGRLYGRKELTAQCLGLIDALDAEPLLKKFPRSMSKGQRQKAGLLVATARPFTVLLLDEPTTALDAESCTALVAALGEFAEQGATVLSSTHDAELIAAANIEFRLTNGAIADAAGGGVEDRSEEE